MTMIKLLYWFTIFLFIYFILYVTWNYYLDHVWGVSYLFPVIKESSWFLFVWYCIWTYYEDIKQYIQQTKIELVLLTIIALWWVITTMLLHWYDITTMINILIWLKYGLYASVIFYTAAAVGYSNALKKSDLLNYINWICHVIIWFCIVGLIRQWAKWIYPHIFYDVLWYGPVWDYMVGKAHPIYYRTWPGWYPRFSWLMSGPNNLGYLLVAYASVIPLFINQRWWKVIYCVAWLMTLSRAAILGAWVQWLLYMVQFARNKSKYVLWGIWLFGIILVIWLSVLKWASTVEHIVRTRWWVQQVINHPRWLWLWSSWPGVHWNWSLLPENFYLQLLIDYGIIPFIWRCVYWYVVIKRTKLMFTQDKQLLTVLRWYMMGLLWLLIIWLFLHVFEDSVVNYIFFIPFGLLWWYWLREFAKLSHSDYN